MATYPYFEPESEAKLAYIRLADRADLPEDVRARTSGMEAIYTIHAADGQVLALTNDRDKAFMLARMNEMRPVSVH